MPELKDIFLPDTVVIRSTLSQDKQVISTAVQSFSVDLLERPKPLGNAPLPVGRGLGDPPLVASKTISYFCAFQGDGPESPFQISIRGVIDLKPGAKAVLVSRIGGMTYSDDLAGAADDTGAYVVSHTVTAIPANGVLVTLFLLIDRTLVDGGLSGASANVEAIEFSLDVTIPKNQSSCS